MGSAGRPFLLNNPHLKGDDFLYHLNLSKSDNLEKRFGDVKYVVMGGKSGRMQKFADHIYAALGKPLNTEMDGNELKDISGSGGRYSLFKVGPVISVNHGIGQASLSVVLHEVFKLVYYAKCTDVSFFRIGTSGGLGVDPGTVVLTKKAYTPMFKDTYKTVCCGRKKKYKCDTDKALRDLIIKASEPLDINPIVGNTMSTNDFFEEQGRVDGAFCAYTEQDKLKYIQRAHDDFGIRNIEMESSLFTAMCGRAKAPCAVLCVTLLNRLNGDQVHSSPDILQNWESQLFHIMTNVIVHNPSSTQSAL